jgi:hypothetical protein
MTNKRQIPFLHWAKRADGTHVAHWKPSPRLRRLGWQNRKLGTRDQEDAVMLAALALNKQVAEWEAQRGIVPGNDKPRRRTFGDLITEYRTSSEWTLLAPATQREYNTRLGFLENWAMEGTLPLAQLDVQMVRDLKEAMLAQPPKAKEGDGDQEENVAEAVANLDDDGKPVNPNLYRTAATLRVLRLLLNWAISRGWITTNATATVRIPTPPSRAAALIPEQVELAAAHALETEFTSLSLAYTLGLWIIQRRADVLALSRLAWRKLENVSPADMPLLANSKGDVMGFRLRQQKTKKWVTCPVPPFLHDAVEAAFERSQWLVPDDKELTRACPPHSFQRRTRAIWDHVGLQDYEFRDLRRSGMMMYAQLGCDLPGITAISGHAIMGKKTILDTYMPGNDRAACGAVATVLRTLAARKEKEQSNA